MTLETLTSEQFDTALQTFIDEQSFESAQSEMAACNELAENSRYCGVVCREADKVLPIAIKNRLQRSMFAAIWAAGIRHGWHLRQIMAESAKLEDLLPEAELEEIRREIKDE